MLRDNAHVLRVWKDKASESFDDGDDEGVADGLIDDDDIFEIIAESAAGSGRPESSWDAVVENLSRIREGRA